MRIRYPKPCQTGGVLTNYTTMKNYTLAYAFSENLRACIGIEKLHDVVLLNQAETNPAVCHSHDYCDANQVMIDTLQAAGINTTVPVDIINGVWNQAKANQFYIASTEQTPISLPVEQLKAIADPFNGLEVQPVRVVDTIERNGIPVGCYEVCEPNEAELWSVYVHLVEGGVSCIADFATQSEAEQFFTFLHSFLKFWDTPGTLSCLEQIREFKRINGSDKLTTEQVLYIRDNYWILPKKKG
jgi:hypothetical protein